MNPVGSESRWLFVAVNVLAVAAILVGAGAATASPALPAAWSRPALLVAAVPPAALAFEVLRDAVRATAPETARSRRGPTWARVACALAVALAVIGGWSWFALGAPG